MRRAFVVLLTVLVIVFVATGCPQKASEDTTTTSSTTSTTADPYLTPDERATVAGFELHVAATVLDGSMYGELLKFIDQVIALARAKPDHIYEHPKGERSMRQVLGDAASSLDGYRPKLMRQLERAIDSLPAPKQ